MATVAEIRDNIQAKTGDEFAKKFEDGLFQEILLLERKNLRALKPFFEKWDAVLKAAGDPDVVALLTSAPMQPKAEDETGVASDDLPGEGDDLLNEMDESAYTEQ